MIKDGLRISKTLEFDAAHRLSFHKGKCRNLHGHTWKVEIAIFSPPSDSDLVLDFGEIKSIILDNFDHKVIVYKNDTLLTEFLKSTDELNAVVVPKEPTAENLAVMISELIETAIKNKFKSSNGFAITVRLYESKDSFAEYYMEVDES